MSVELIWRLEAYPKMRDELERLPPKMLCLSSSAEATPVELVLGCMISAIDVANRLLYEQVHHVMYVCRVEVRDYKPSPHGAVDDLMDRMADAAAALQKVGDRIGDGIKAAIDKRPSRRTAR